MKNIKEITGANSEIGLEFSSNASKLLVSYDGVNFKAGKGVISTKLVKSLEVSNSTAIIINWEGNTDIIGSNVIDLTDPFITVAFVLAATAQSAIFKVKVNSANLGEAALNFGNNVYCNNTKYDNISKEWIPTEAGVYLISVYKTYPTRYDVTISETPYI